MDALSTLNRLFPRIDIRPGGCWVWTGTHTEKGYGKVRIDGRTWRVHRLVWALSFGSEPEEDLDHTCRVRDCCNPTHLRPLSHAAHGATTAPAPRTHCKNGHEFTPDNSYVRTRPDGTFRDRQCRVCRAESRGAKLPA